jgi:hypothetical protein
MSKGLLIFPSTITLAYTPSNVIFTSLSRENVLHYLQFFGEVCISHATSSARAIVILNNLKMLDEQKKL